MEELKKKTAYYSTKSLLERYDQTSSQKEDKKSSIKENKQIGIFCVVLGLIREINCTI